MSVGPDWGPTIRGLFSIIACQFGWHGPWGIPFKQANGTCLQECLTCYKGYRKAKCP